MHVFTLIGALAPQFWTIKWNSFLVLFYEIYILVFTSYFKVTVNYPT